VTMRFQMAQHADRITALRGRLDKALGREVSASPVASRAAELESGQDRGSRATADRLRTRLAELGQRVRKDDERDRDRTRDRDRGREGPGR